MRNYLDTIYTISQYKQDFKKDFPHLAEQAEKAQDVLKYYTGYEFPEKYVIIEVEGYTCVAYMIKSDYPYELAEQIVPFDKNKIYPIQGLITKYLFKQYHLGEL